jgi:hypothetical protein
MKGFSSDNLNGGIFSALAAHYLFPLMGDLHSAIFRLLYQPAS